MDEEERRLAEELFFSEKKKPSFAKQLFFGKFDYDRVHPFPKPSDEEDREIESFVEKVRDFAEERVDPDKIDREGQISYDVMQGLADLGVLGMTVPKEYGGLGMSQYAYCRTMETLARRCASTALFVSVHQSIGLKALLLFGTEEQKKRWLPPMARGEMFGAFALTEPNAGSDANGVETRAVYDPDKKIYRMNGEKQWITNGAFAKVLTVMAKTEVETPRGKEEKVTAFLVTPDMAGFRVKDRNKEKVGMRGTWTANLEFNDVDVPEENILGPLGGGLKVALTVLDFGRTTFGATCTGVAKDLVRRATDHAINRYQFKRPIASFALVKKKISTISALAYAMESTTYLTAGFIDSDVEDLMLESAMLKVFTSEALWKIVYESMQILGGRSFFTDEPYERMMRDARLNTIGEGANEVLRAFIGIVGMRDVGMELKDTAEAFRGFKLGQMFTLCGKMCKRLTKPAIPIPSPHLKEEVTMLAKTLRTFSMKVGKLLYRYREDIVERELQLDRMASVAIALYTSTAVLSRLNTELALVNQNPEALGQDVAIGKFYCSQALRMAGHFLQATEKNSDTQIENLSDQITGLENV